jgi:hypothetical protein
MAITLHHGDCLDVFRGMEAGSVAHEEGEGTEAAVNGQLDATEPFPAVLARKAMDRRRLEGAKWLASLDYNSADSRRKRRNQRKRRGK